MTSASDIENKGRRSAESALTSEVRRFSGFVLDGDTAADAARSLAGFVTLLDRIDREQAGAKGASDSEAAVIETFLRESGAYTRRTRR